MLFLPGPRPASLHAPRYLRSNEVRRANRYYTARMLICEREKHATGVRVKDGNKLVFQTRFGEVGLVALRVYQARDGREVTGCFAWGGDSWGIGVGGYDCEQGLVIDPPVYSTYLGGSQMDISSGIAVDGSRHAYVTGGTGSSDFDVTPGAFQTTYEGSLGNAFVTKLNTTGR